MYELYQYKIIDHGQKKLQAVITEALNQARCVLSFLLLVCVRTYYLVNKV